MQCVEKVRNPSLACGEMQCVEKVGL
jgi:hypothetical protein